MKWCVYLNTPPQLARILNTKYLSTTKKSLTSNYIGIFIPHVAGWDTVQCTALSMILAFCVYAACLWSSLTPQQAPHIGFLLPYGPRPEGTEGNKTKTEPNTKQGNQGVAESLSYTQLKEPSLQLTSCTCYHWYLMHHSMYSSTFWLNERRPAELARNNFNLPAAQLVKHFTAHCFDGLRKHGDAGAMYRIHLLPHMAPLHWVVHQCTAQGAGKLAPGKLLP